MENLNEFIISPDATIEEAMVAIEKNEHRSLVVVDHKQIVQGAISDGDIRKLIISHHLLSTKVRDVMNRNFIFVFDGNRDDAKRILSKKSYIFLIPVVDPGMRLLDIIARGTRAD